MYSKEEINIANKTSRNSKAIGQKAIVPRVIKELFSPKQKLKILDFGAGKAAAHTLSLREEGYDVTAYEFGNNIIDGLHDPKALKTTYDVIYASNVINVLSSFEMLLLTIGELDDALKVGGVIIANYPNSPRKLDFNPTEIAELLNIHFNVERIQEKNIVFKLTKKNI